MEKIKGLKLEVNFTELYDDDNFDLELIAEALRRIVDQIEAGETSSSADDYVDEFSVDFEYEQYDEDYDEHQVTIGDFFEEVSYEQEETDYDADFKKYIEGNE